METTVEAPRENTRLTQNTRPTENIRKSGASVIFAGDSQLVKPECYRDSKLIKPEFSFNLGRRSYSYAEFYNSVILNNIYYAEEPSEHSTLTESSIATTVEEQSISIPSVASEVFKERIDENEVYIGEIKKQSIYDEYKAETHKYAYPPIMGMKEVFEGRTDVLDLSFYVPDEVNLYLIFQKLEENRILNIRKLDLSYNQFSNTTCVTLSAYLEISSITELNLGHCEIGREGIEILAEGMDLAQHLENVNLTYCNLGDEGGRALAPILKTNEFIKILDLSHNNLQTRFAIDFGKILKFNTALTHLNLSWNNLYFEKGFKKLTRGLRSNKSLIYLDLSWNGLVGPDCSYELFRLLKLTKNIQIMHIENNLFSPMEMDELIDGLKYSKSIVEFYMGGNNITQELVKSCITGTCKYKLLSFGESYYMSDVKVIKELKKFKEKNPDIKLIYHGNVKPNPPEPINYRDIVLSRARFVAEKPKSKKAKKDMGHFMLQILDMDIDYMRAIEFQELLDGFKARLDDDLKAAFIEAFKIKIPTGKKKKITRIDVRKMAEQYLKKFPTERLPPKQPKSGKKGKKSAKSPSPRSMSKARK